MITDIRVHAHVVVFSIVNTFNDNVFSVLPTLYVVGTGVGHIRDQDIKTVYKFPNSRLDFVAATYSYNGSYLGLQSIDNGLFQLCKQTKKYLNAAWVFGTSYYQSVIMKYVRYFNPNCPR